MNEELKACPCGGKVERQESYDQYGQASQGFRVECVQCGMNTGVHAAQHLADQVWGAAIAPAESGDGAKPQYVAMDVAKPGSDRAVYVCPVKDIECGSNPATRCDACPLNKPDPTAAVVGSMVEPVRPIGMATSSSVLGVEWFGGQPDNGTIVYPESAIQHLQSQIAELEESRAFMNGEAKRKRRYTVELKQRIDDRDRQIATLTQQLADHEEVNADKKRIAREIAVALNGADAAKQPSLCDLLAQLNDMREKAGAPVSEFFDSVAQQLAEARERKQDQHIFVGYTNGHQILYGSEPDGQGAFYPTPDNECLIPIYMLKIHAHRLQTTSNMDVTLEQIQKLRSAARLESGTQGEQ